ncbi:sugar-binding transcriptional regulator [Pseudogemmobacter bohemicus]|uniref:sugar-binding transcriptional regulator n=1 Tax=Pseudogemmobacter bohemicus TaxID=2250708 RepID=UPI001E5F03C1|nr:sugar-binding domain-containing protein [Pseudogemmobacter bohemicus]
MAAAMVETPEDEVLMARAAWLYYIGGLNQEATAKRLNTTRARVNKLLSDARDAGLVSITINPANVGLLPVEELIRTRYGLDFCICTPALGPEKGDETDRILAPFAFRAVGAAAAAHLRRHLAEEPRAVIGTGWGRTLEQMTLQMAGVTAPGARFISLMGSLTANSAWNPFEVVQSLARSTRGEGYFLPVPFIADTPEARSVLVSQQSVQDALDLGRRATMAYISLGELREDCLLRRQGMITGDELAELRSRGAVGDTNGLFFDAAGRGVDHPLNHRTIGLGLEDLRQIPTVALVAGRAKLEAARGFLASGIVSGLIIDGDTALELAGSAPA